jgi:hypothetical protein
MVPYEKIFFAMRSILHVFLEETDNSNQITFLYIFDATSSCNIEYASCRCYEADWKASKTKFY